MKKLLPVSLIIMAVLACNLPTTVNNFEVATVVAAELTQEYEAITVEPTVQGVPTFAPPIAVTQRQITPYPTDVLPTPVPSLTVAVPTTIPQTIKKSGKNDLIVPVPEMVPGYQFIGLTKTGDGVFTVFSCDAAGNHTNVLVDTTGAYSGWQYISANTIIPRFEVVASGEWTIEIRPNIKGAAPEVTAPTTYHGEGDSVLVVSCCAEHKPDVADFNYPGEGDFAVFSITKDGTREQLISQKGPYQGQVGMPKRLAFLEIRAVGGWDMNMTEKPAQPAPTAKPAQ
jgi:hypothetical protein